jgi:hypothetical protein
VRSRRDATDPIGWAVHADPMARPWAPTEPSPGPASLSGRVAAADDSAILGLRFCGIIACRSPDQSVLPSSSQGR